ncbi:protein of unknown function [Nitrospina watsonii]|uniref:Uncharacterized protein n=1 Tax=Nitrospina watsonii TaxID=1323948 RepID=A0ABN8W383_9BACT|nr:protein of unknown function [Nitrospina watsonii]
MPPLLCISRQTEFLGNARTKENHRSPSPQPSPIQGEGVLKVPSPLVGALQSDRLG